MLFFLTTEGDVQNKKSQKVILSDSFYSQYSAYFCLMKMIQA